MKARLGDRQSRVRFGRAQAAQVARCGGGRRGRWLVVFGVGVGLLAASVGCRDAPAKREDARILAEFRGPNFIASDERRAQPLGPPLVPHVVYARDFDCLVCHGHRDFVFRGQPVKQCMHPERSACLQCHVPIQNREAPFRFEMLGSGA